MAKRTMNNPMEAEELALRSEEKTNKEESKLEAFEVPNGGENMYWLKVTPAAMFDPSTGEQMAKSFVMSYDEADYLLMKNNAASLGYSYEVLYSPTK